ncbi:hypothetical protein C0V82_07205 [Niveispirillum cyanobacteriorum]|uniref:Resolvase HTH domain-containing protein n=3 Tax=Niveispirillum cyanobacteriorum TaxID=1612173 RepID=A0A2K9NA91_9PROT|nr:hypothetical protein [Niveispirillum cyanobacteriorum]AUN30038.1 hypothetical protein C0V82_07205 [Niveispirillum cyanobacteriorum]
MSLSHNPYDTDHPTLTPQEQAEAWWRGSSDLHTKPFTEDVGFAPDEHLTEGYTSRKVTDVAWAKIAFHIAAGRKIKEITAEYGVSRTTIWRALQRSHNLRRRIAEERALLRREAESRFVSLRTLVVDSIYHAVASGDMRATLWAADRLGLGGDLLQPAEKKPKPGYARIPSGWFSPDDADAIRLDPLTAPTAEDPTLAAELPDLSAPSAQADPLASSSPLSSSSRRKPGPRGQTPDPSTDQEDAEDPIPNPTPPTTDAMGQSGDYAPDHPPELRFAPPRPPARVKAACPPMPRNPAAPFRPAARRRRPAPRLLVRILHETQTVLDNLPTAPGLTNTVWAERPRWLSWAPKPGIL